MDAVAFVIQLACGVLGASLAGTRWASVPLGRYGTALAGVVGGALGGVLLNGAFLSPHGAGPATLDSGMILSQLTGGGIGGAGTALLVSALCRACAR